MAGSTADRVENVRARLVARDPIGVFGVAQTAPRDEHDRLVGPLLSTLDRGDAPAQISAVLARDLAHHFGIDPTAANPEGFTVRIIASSRGEVD